MLKVFAVFDIKAESHGNLITLPAVGLATRTFSDAINAPNSPLGDNPEDYSLYELGTYDPVSGRMMGLERPKFIAHAVEFKKKSN